jgi:hypothetical protein
MGSISLMLALVSVERIKTMAGVPLPAYQRLL